MGQGGGILTQVFDRLGPGLGGHPLGALLVQGPSLAGRSSGAHVGCIALPCQEVHSESLHDPRRLPSNTTLCRLKSLPGFELLSRPHRGGGNSLVANTESLRKGTYSKSHMS